eukprot:365598-Chlamydomonas_euryale.AAC.4
MQKRHTGRTIQTSCFPQCTSAHQDTGQDSCLGTHGRIAHMGHMGRVGRQLLWRAWGHGRHGQHGPHRQDSCFGAHGGMADMGNMGRMGRTVALARMEAWQTWATWGAWAGQFLWHARAHGTEQIGHIGRTVACAWQQYGMCVGGMNLSQALLRQSTHSRPNLPASVLPHSI